MKIGVNLWTLYGWTPKTTLTSSVLTKLRTLGAETVELIMGQEQFAANRLLAAQPEFSAELDGLEMTVSGVASGLFWQYNPGSQHRSIRNQALRTIQDQCRIAQAYGASVVLVVPGMQESRTDYNQTYDTAVETIRLGARYAEEHGVVIGLENVATSFLQSPKEFAKFLTDVDSPWVQAYLDVGNVLASRQAYPENWIWALREHLASVHVKDYDEADTSLRGFRLCGEGTLDWDETFAALGRANYEGPLVIETPPGDGTNIDLESGLQAAEVGINWLRQFIKA